MSKFSLNSSFNPEFIINFLQVFPPRIMFSLQKKNSKKLRKIQNPFLKSIVFVLYGNI